MWHLVSGFAKAGAKLQLFFILTIQFHDFFQNQLYITGFSFDGIKIISICYISFFLFLRFSLYLHQNKVSLNNTFIYEKII